KSRVKGLGYEVKKTGVSAFYSDRRELIFAALCGITLAFAWVSPALGFPVLSTNVLFAAAYFFGGYDIARHALHSVQERQFDTDLLMILAAAGAAFLGEFIEGGLLLFLFSLGHALEELALDKARDAVSKLGKLTPKTATVIRDGKEVEVSVDEVEIDELVIVRPGVRVPVDGSITSGSSAIDQSPITGESMPVEKSIGDQVFAGSVNGNGALQVRVTKLAKDNTLARVMQLVEESQTQKTKTQQLTEKFTGWFVPAVLIIDLLLIALPPLFGIPIRIAFFRAMTFLVAVSPCALALGPPSAMLCGIGQAARNGLLIKGGIHLETLGKVEAIAFDKTGTLTNGKPEVTDVVITGKISEDELLSLAAACESRSGHPLAAAVVAAANSRGIKIPEPEKLDSVTGQGLIATVVGRRVLVGNRKLMETQNISLSDEVSSKLQAFEEIGKTSILVAVDGEIASIIALADTPRSNARQALEVLHKIGIKQIFLLSGDNIRVANKLAKDLGIDEVKAGLMPEEKVQAMQQLASDRVVAMVGDGVNDAPALAAASIGIAMGGASTDVALETADVALMGDDLSKLPFAVSLGRATRAVVLQNLVISIATILGLAGAAILGVTTIGWAILFHEGSTLLVVANSLRLLAHNDQSAHAGRSSNE
ncbi:MAG: cadmium-translocating P-type ATPase, partial [Candidatus Obscuribacterales bacterium]|nr:cadmium-translocating P-type ATPase [Candidatus Obscuribacterales bacterium]